MNIRNEKNIIYPEGKSIYVNICISFIIFKHVLASVFSLTSLTCLSCPQGGNMAGSLPWTWVVPTSGELIRDKRGWGGGDFRTAKRIKEVEAEPTSGQLKWGKREGRTSGQPKQYKKLGPTSG
jgi:hypothetical protein